MTLPPGAMPIPASASGLLYLTAPQAQGVKHWIDADSTALVQHMRKAYPSLSRHSTQYHHNFLTSWKRAKNQAAEGFMVQSATSGGLPNQGKFVAPEAQQSPLPPIEHVFIDILSPPIFFAPLSRCRSGGSIGGCKLRHFHRYELPCARCKERGAPTAL